MLMPAAEYRDSLRRYHPRVFVNGQRVDRRILRDGDLLTIGSTELEFKAQGG